MSTNYRIKYEKEIGWNIKLESGSSIHHLNKVHSDSTFKNMVALPQNLHNDLNITFDKMPKLLKLMLKVKCYWKIHRKTLKDLQQHIDNYQKILVYVEMRDSIKLKGYEFTIEKFGRELVEEIYKKEKK